MSQSVSSSAAQQEGCSSGEIDHTTALTNGMAALLSSAEFSDVTFVVNGERLHAHRLILITRSEYFRAMLTGGLKESVGAEVELQGTNPLAFRTLLRYIYTGKAELSAFTIDEVMAIFGLAHEYMLIEVQKAIISYMKVKLSTSNVFTVAQTSTLLSLDALTEVCNQFCDLNAPTILKCKEFVALPQESVIEMLRRDSFCAEEINVFSGVAKWIKAQSAMEPTSMETLVKRFFSENCVRLHLMTEKQLINCFGISALFLGNSGVVDTYIIYAIRQKLHLQFSGNHEKLNENVVSAELGAPEVNDPMVHEEGNIITITLDRPYTINRIVFQPPHFQTARPCSITVQVSTMERENWKRLVRNRAFDMQYPLEISFDASVVRYIERQYALVSSTILSKGYDMISIGKARPLVKALCNAFVSKELFFLI